MFGGCLIYFSKILRSFVCYFRLSSSLSSSSTIDSRPFHNLIGILLDIGAESCGGIVVCS